MPKKKEEEEAPLFYLYTDAKGKPLYRIHYSPLGEITYTVPDYRRHYRKAVPLSRVPYGLPRVANATYGMPIFVLGNEEDVDLVDEFDVVATIGVPDPLGGHFPAGWKKWFADRSVFIIPSQRLAFQSVAAKAKAVLTDVAKLCVVVEPSNMKPNEDFVDWFKRVKHDGHSFKEQIYSEVEAAVRALEGGPGVEPGSTEVAVEISNKAEDEEDVEYSDDSWKPFPLEVFHPTIAEYIQAASESLPVDPAMLVLPVLCSLGACIGTSRCISLKDDWQEPSIFWGALIAESSSTKSPSVKKAVGPLEAVEDALMAMQDQEYKTFQWDKFDYDRCIEKNKGAQSPDELISEPLPPKEKVFQIEDITVEAICKMHRDNPKGLYIVRDELAGFAGSFSRYRSGKGGGSDMDFYLEAFNGKWKRIDRKSGDDPTIKLRQTAINIFGGIQPKPMRALFTPDFFTKGFAARTLFIQPPRRQKVWTEYCIPPELTQWYADCCKGLYFLSYDEIDAKTWRPKRVELTRAAKDRWIPHYNAWAEIQHGADGDTAAALAKLEAYTARFALQFALADYVTGTMKEEVVDACHVERAEILVKWFHRETNRVYSMLKKPEVEVTSDRTLEFIAQRGGCITPKRFFLSNPTKYGDSKRAKAMLDGLVSQGKGHWETRSGGDKGGRPSLTFVLKPNQT